MARKNIRSNNVAVVEQMRVELIPVESRNEDHLIKIREIHRLVTQIVLLGKKRGRPTQKNDEVEDAA